MADRDIERRHVSDLMGLTTDELRERLREAEEVLDAIRSGSVDAVIGLQEDSPRLYTIQNADQPYRELIEQMHEGALMLSGEGAVLYANRRVSDLLGKSLDAIVAHTFEEHVDAAEQDNFRRFIAIGLIRPIRREFELSVGNAKRVPVSISLSPLRVTAVGEQTVVCAVISDLSEQRQIEGQLRQSQKMEAVGQLTGGLAHDFNNLLQAIHGNLELIQRLPREAEKVKLWAHNAARSVQRGAKLTAQLLAFSRTQATSLSSLLVDDLIKGMAEMLTRSLGRSVAVSFDLSAGAVPVTADHTQLELALLNLAINARDAMPDGGALNIASRVTNVEDDAELAAGSYVEIRVRDDGQGMSEEVRSKAFEPFFTTKGVGAGTGLGLAQVFGISRQAGGTARIESETGHGTTISIFLRRTDLPVEQNIAQPTAHAAYSIQSRRILVVDDDAEIRASLVESLRLCGYGVDAAVDPADALRHLDHSLPDVVILDYSMPIMTGGELGVAIRARLPQLPIVFVTGFVDDLELASIPGPQPAVLMKPFPVEVLANTIARMLE